MTAIFTTILITVAAVNYGCLLYFAETPAVQSCTLAYDENQDTQAALEYNHREGYPILHIDAQDYSIQIPLGYDEVYNIAIQLENGENAEIYKKDGHLITRIDIFSEKYITYTDNNNGYYDDYSDDLILLY